MQHVFAQELFSAKQQPRPLSCAHCGVS